MSVDLQIFLPRWNLYSAWGPLDLENRQWRFSVHRLLYDSSPERNPWWIDVTGLNRKSPWGGLGHVSVSLGILLDPPECRHDTRGRTVQCWNAVTERVWWVVPWEFHSRLHATFQSTIAHRICERFGSTKLLASGWWTQTWHVSYIQKYRCYNRARDG